MPFMTPTVVSLWRNSITREYTLVSFRMQILLCVVMCRVLGCRVCSCSLPPCCCLFGFANHRRRNMRLLVGRWVDRSIPLRRYEVIVFRATSLSLSLSVGAVFSETIVVWYHPSFRLKIFLPLSLSPLFRFVSFCFGLYLLSLQKVSLDRNSDWEKEHASVSGLCCSGIHLPHWRHSDLDWFLWLIHLYSFTFSQWMDGSTDKQHTGVSTSHNAFAN